jgi:hypothetical protein
MHDAVRQLLGGGEDFEITSAPLHRNDPSKRFRPPRALGDMLQPAPDGVLFLLGGIASDDDFPEILTRVHLAARWADRPGDPHRPLQLD